MDATICPNCFSTALREDAVEGKKYCTTCGTVVGEMVLTEEVGFGETSSGAVVADGMRISAGATGVSFGRQNRFGGTSQELTESAGRRRCMDVATVMNLGQGIGESAGRIWFLAYQQKFTRGRRGELVVGACVYLACRQRSDPPPVMLIDFSDRLNNVNVFEIGAIYLKLLKVVPLKDIHPLDPSIYIHRFASLLEFGDDLRQVETDAVRLVQRFSRDWMATGRRPSGICGACIILAARMNNFRRSVAEVVQVVKIADVTIKKRLEEFQRSASGQLTVAQFRTMWLEQEENPPAFIKNRQVETSKLADEARSARGSSMGASSQADSEDGQDEQDQQGTGGKRKGKSSQPPPTKRLRLAGTAANGVVTPPSSLPASPLRQVTNSTAGPGPSTLASTDAQRREADAGAHLEHDSGEEDDGMDKEVIDEAVGAVLNESMADNEIAHEFSRIEHDKDEELHTIQERIAHQPDDDPLKGLDEDELDDYILDPVESKIKMHTWISTNMDYLIKLQEKLRKHKLDELQEEAEAEHKKPRVRRGPVGPAESAAASTKGLLERKHYSRNVNYRAIENLFKSGPEDGQESREATPLNERVVEDDKDGIEKLEDGEEEEEEQDEPVHTTLDHEQWD